jgi:hypothetical protein
MNKEDINNPNSSIISNVIEAIIKSLTTKKSPGADNLQLNSGRLLRTSIILKLFHRIKREGTLSNTFYKASIKYPDTKTR